AAHGQPPRVRGHAVRVLGAPARRPPLPAAARGRGSLGAGLPVIAALDARFARGGPPARALAPAARGGAPARLLALGVAQAELRLRRPRGELRGLYVSAGRDGVALPAAGGVGRGDRDLGHAARGGGLARAAPVAEELAARAGRGALLPPAARVRPDAGHLQLHGPPVRAVRAGAARGLRRGGARAPARAGRARRRAAAVCRESRPRAR